MNNWHLWDSIVPLGDDGVLFPSFSKEDKIRKLKEELKVSDGDFISCDEISFMLYKKLFKGFQSLIKVLFIQIYHFLREGCFHYLNSHFNF